MGVVEATLADAEEIASIVSQSNKDVADRFGLTMETAPSHPSFCTTEWVLSGFNRGEIYFLFKEGDVAKGCVAFEQSDLETAYLNRLAVLPPYRHQGIGANLVQFILAYSKIKHVQRVSVGIIAEHDVLKNWYVTLGFVEDDTRTFGHLPFKVTYMHYNL